MVALQIRNGDFTISGEEIVDQIPRRDSQVAGVPVGIRE